MAYLPNRFYFMKKCIIWPYLLGFLFIILLFLSFPVLLLWDSPIWRGDLEKDSYLSFSGLIHTLRYSLWCLFWEQEWNQLLSDAEGHQSCQIFHVSSTLLAGSGTRSGYRQERKGTEMNRNCSHPTTFPNLSMSIRKRWPPAQQNQGVNLQGNTGLNTAPFTLYIACGISGLSWQPLLSLSSQKS